jgi:predicted transcriptional regulator
MKVDGSNLTSKQVISLAKLWGFAVSNPTGLHNSGHTILTFRGQRVQVRAPGRTSKEYTPRVVIAKLAAARGLTRKEFLAGPQNRRTATPPAVLPTAPPPQETVMPTIGNNPIPAPEWGPNQYPKAAAALVKARHGDGTQARRVGMQLLILLTENDPLDYPTIKKRLTALYGEDQATKMMQGAVPRTVTMLEVAGFVRRDFKGRDGSFLYRATPSEVQPKPVKNDLQQRAEKMAERVKTEGPKHKKDDLPELLEPVGYSLDGRLMLVDDKGRLWVAERKEL